MSASKIQFSKAVRKNQEMFLIAILQDKELKDISTAMTEVLQECHDVLLEELRELQPAREEDHAIETSSSEPVNKAFYCVHPL
ncbi:hypothetical protein K7432_014183 [Basidiobolus ranarum]|uniref:Uncharacterized protein n=1 Tax=Basidiobolus ranarum TaxID=34480 RepID=A0ABR2WI02_9FUNG